MIRFNRPFQSGDELKHIHEAIESGRLSGDGHFTRECHKFFETQYSFQKVLLTTSATSALEIAALLLNLREGDEIIIPSFTFVSTANAFVLRGAKIVFADSTAEHPNVDHTQLEELITARTRAIVVVHYAGVACDMDPIMALALKHKLVVVEDAAQAVDSFYRSRPLGGIGDLGVISFHETKNISCGEGGLLILKDSNYFLRAEIIREKGTNRTAFFRGEVDKYQWVDVGSSYLPSELNAAYLFGQLSSIDRVQARRLEIWNSYHQLLRDIDGKVQLPIIPDYASNNAHIYYLVCEDQNQRTDLIAHLRRKGILAIFHYQALHRSQFYASQHDGRELPNCVRYSDCLIRLPLFYELTDHEVEYISDEVISFFR